MASRRRPNETKHQSGPSALLTIHLSPEQRLQLITVLPKLHEAIVPVAESSG